MDRTVYGRPLPAALRGLGWALAGVSLLVVTLLGLVHQVLGNLQIRPVVAVARVGAAVAWFALCGALAYLSVR